MCVIVCLLTERQNLIFSVFDLKLNYLFRDAIKKKIENFGGFILKGGRGSPQKPNFCIPLIWDILVRREGVKTWIPKFICQFYWQNFTHNGVHFFNPSLIFFNFHSILIFIMHDVSLWYDNDKISKSVQCPNNSRVSIDCRELDSY